MGKFREIVQFEKQNMPEYQYNFLYHRVFPGFIFVFGGLLICVIFIVVGAILDIMLLGIIPTCIWGLGTFALLTLYVVYSKKLSQRLIDDKTAEFENYYTLIDYEMAKNELAKENVIVDGKLVLENEEEAFLTQESINVEDCFIELFCKTWSGAFYFRLVFYRKIDNIALMIADINENIYTFFARNMHLIKNNRLFQLFVENKREFLKLLFQYNDSRKMEWNMNKISKRIKSD